MNQNFLILLEIGLCSVLASAATVFLILYWWHRRNADNALAAPKQREGGVVSPGALRFAIFATVLFMALGLTVYGGWQNNMNNGPYGGLRTQPPLTYGRNLSISTGNDSLGLVISKPQPTNGITNDFFEAWEGGNCNFSVNSNGAVGCAAGLGGGAAASLLNSNGVGQTQTNLGFQTWTWASPSATSTNYFIFTPPFPYGVVPTIIIGHGLDSNWVLTVNSNSALITNNAGTAAISVLAIGQ